MSYACPHCGHVNMGLNDAINRWCWKCEQFETEHSFAIHSLAAELANKLPDTDDELSARVRELFRKREGERPTAPAPPPAADPSP